MRAFCAGSFDPVTIGHYSYISRLAALFDSVVVAVSTNAEKKYMFSAEERLRYIKQAFAALENVEVVAQEGWVADFAVNCGADVIVKGLRGAADTEYENVISAVNRAASGIETLYIPTLPEYSQTSSTAVREMLRYGKDASAFLPEGVVIEFKKDGADK